MLLCATLLLFVACQKAPELTITSPSSIELDVNGNSGAITFTANRDWSASTSDSWISISPSSGKASDTPVTVTIRCNANTTYDERTATVTISMEDLSQTVSVHQPANLAVILPKQVFDLQSNSNTIEIEVQANVQYSVSTSVDWIKQVGTKGLTSKTLSFSIEENKTYDPREGKITIKPQDSSVQEQVVSVKQAQKDALIVEKTSYDMPYGGGEIEIKVESNIPFDVTPNPDWIHYTQTKALSSSTVCLKIDENTTYSSRQGTVEIKQQNGSLKYTITVSQAGRIAITSVELDQTSLFIKPGETTTLTATVKPDNATDKTVTWSSSNTAIATVDETGKVTAVKEGTARIIAKAGEKAAECKVTVCIPVSSIELDKTELSLKPGETAKLTATVKPDNATDKTVTWTSSDSEIATVDNTGKVLAIKNRSATITAKAGEKSAICSVLVVPDGAVDLGIIMTRTDGSTYRLFWAKCNIGASKPEEYGDYYAWGETEAKSSYSWNSYKWRAKHDEHNKFAKYCPTNKTDYWDGAGSPDGKTVLDPEDDVAHVKLGGKWRMPTGAEWLALLYSDICTWTWTTQNGVYGRKVTSNKNGNSIFLPTAGYLYNGPYLSAGSGNYWSSSLDTDYPDYALGVYFESDMVGGSFEPRYYGQSVRAVSE